MARISRSNAGHVHAFVQPCIGYPFGAVNCRRVQFDRSSRIRAPSVVNTFDDPAVKDAMATKGGLEPQ
jgi:hypothetical protein